jgi:hypothetical protein
MLHHGYLGGSVDWGQYTDDGPLARACVEEPAASAWPPVIVAFFFAEGAASPAPAGPPASKRAGPAGAELASEAAPGPPGTAPGQTPSQAWAVRVGMTQ